MKIAVCIKQVPDGEHIKINPQTNTLERDSAESVLNPFDLYAVEEAVRLSNSFTHGESIALSMGPPQAQSVLRQAIALGIEESVLLCDKDFAGADSWATSCVLAAGIRKSGAKIVLCGKQATDGDTAQVAPAIAAHLKWPQACYVTEFMEISETSATVKRLMDYGTEIIQVDLPAVFSVLKDINKPRLPNLPGLLKGRSQTITTWSRQDIGLKEKECGLAGSPTRVRRIFSPTLQHNACQLLKAETAKERSRLLAEKIKQFMD